MESINIIISIDKKSVDVINPLIKSIIMHNDANIFVITDEYIEIEYCTTIVKENKWNGPYGRITGHTYHRLFLDEYFPNINKCIWLDFDTIVLSDISDLLDGDDWEIKVYGVNNNIINAGVIAFNFTDECKNKMAKCRDLIYKEKDDQRILNKVFGDTFYPMPIEYNAMSFVDVKNPKIIHYVGDRKPWMIPNAYYYWLKYKNNDF